MTSLKLALGLALNHSTEHRWRRFMVFACAAIFTLTLMSSASLLLMFQNELARAEERTPVSKAKPSSDDLLMLEVYDQLEEDTIYVFWIQPTEADSLQTILPPGVSELPSPGKAVVSPALKRLESENSTLTKRYANAEVIEEEGLLNEDELLAYQSPPEGRDLFDEELTQRVKSFGIPRNSSDIVPLGLEERVPTFALIEGTLGFVILPGLLTLAIGVRAASRVRDHRFDILKNLGVSYSRISVIAALETLFLAAPAIVLASVFWVVISPLLGYVPFVGHDSIVGDLAIGWRLALLLAACSIVTVALLATTATYLRLRRANQGPHPGLGATVVHDLRLTPIVLSIAAIVSGSFVGGIVGALILLGGMAAIVVTLPLLLPNFLRLVGGWLANRRSFYLSMSGREMQFDPARVSRPFAGGAALIVIALAGSGYLSLIDNLNGSDSATAGTAMFMVDWFSPEREDYNRLSRELESGLVIPYQEKPDGEVALAATCEELSRYIPGAECQPNAPHRLPEEMRLTLLSLSSTYIMMFSDISNTLLNKNEMPAKSGKAFVLLGNDTLYSERLVRVAAWDSVPVTQVLSLSSVRYGTSPLAPWISGGLTCAIFILGFCCAASIVDRFLQTRVHRTKLLAIGVSTKGLNRLEGVLFALPFFLVTLLGYLVGLLVCLQVIGVFSDVPFPWTRALLLLLAIAVSGTTGTFLALLLGDRSLHTRAD